MHLFHRRANTYFDNNKNASEIITTTFIFCITCWYACRQTDDTYQQICKNRLSAGEFMF
jgi:hypothetical protein